jgi:hypothetical protein
MKKFKIELRTRKESDIFEEKIQELFKFNNQILRKNYKFTISNYSRVRDKPKFYAGIPKHINSRPVQKINHIHQRR